MVTWLEYLKAMLVDENKQGWVWQSSLLHWKTVSSQKIRNLGESKAFSFFSRRFVRLQCRRFTLAISSFCLSGIHCVHDRPQFYPHTIELPERKLAEDKKFLLLGSLGLCRSWSGRRIPFGRSLGFGFCFGRLGRLFSFHLGSCRPGQLDH